MMILLMPQSELKIISQNRLSKKRKALKTSRLSTNDDDDTISVDNSE
jgi:hypothetical protein